MAHKLFGQVDLWHFLTFQEQHGPTDQAQTRTDLKYGPLPSSSIRIHKLEEEAGIEHVIGPCSFITASSHTFLLQISRIYLNTYNRTANRIKPGEKPAEKVLRVAPRKRIYHKTQEAPKTRKESEQQSRRRCSNRSAFSETQYVFFDLNLDLPITFSPMTRRHLIRTASLLLGAEIPNKHP